MSKNQGKDMAVYSEVARQGYEASVMARMAGRSGAYTPKGAQGIAHEIMANDKYNVTHVFEGTAAEMTKSPVAKQVDAVIKNGNRNVGRIQYKDTPSPSGIQKTLRQVQDGKYRQTQLWGTEETAKEFNRLAPKRGITKQMKSTGISTETTKRIGDKFTGQASNLSGVGKVAGKSAAFGAGLTAATEVVKSVINGDSVGECAGNVVTKSAESAITAGASTVAAETAFAVTTKLLAQTSIPVIGPFLAAAGTVLVVGKVAGELTDGVFDGVGDGISDAVDEGVDIIADAATGIADGVEEIAGGFCDVVENVFDGVGSFFEGLFCW